MFEDADFHAGLQSKELTSVGHEHTMNHRMLQTAHSSDVRPHFSFVLSLYKGPKNINPPGGTFQRLAVSYGTHKGEGGGGTNNKRKSEKLTASTRYTEPITHSYILSLFPSPYKIMHMAAAMTYGRLDLSHQAAQIYCLPSKRTASQTYSHHVLRLRPTALCQDMRPRRPTARTQLQLRPTSMSYRRPRPTALCRIRPFDPTVSHHNTRGVQITAE